MTRGAAAGRAPPRGYVRAGPAVGRGAERGCGAAVGTPTPGSGTASAGASCPCSAPCPGECELAVGRLLAWGGDGVSGASRAGDVAACRDIFLS